MKPELGIIKMLGFWEKANKLKKTLRYAAYKEDQDFIESPSDHTWRMTLIAIDIFKRFNLKLDFSHVIEIIVFHDLVEYPLERDVDVVELIKGEVSREVKKEAEKKVMKNLAIEFDASYAYDLFIEYEEQKTISARFVKFIDKLEAMTHILARGLENNTKMKDPDIILALCDKSVQFFPDLIPIVTEVKYQYKRYFDEHNFTWDKVWEVGHLKNDVDFIKTK